MRYLKSFESKLKNIQYKDMTTWGSDKPQKVLKEIDPSYFGLVFADFIDDGAKIDFDIEHAKDIYETYWEIFIEEPKLYNPGDIDGYLNSIDELKDLYLDIQTAVKRIKDEYPHIVIDFRIEESGENNAWVDTTQKDIHLTFSYKNL